MSEKAAEHTFLQAKHVLAEAKQIHTYNERIRKENAQNFDFFTALTSWYDEEDHSKFIGSLLDPSGPHGQDALFLAEFLEEIGCDKASESEWQVAKEFWIGANKRNRRIDLLVQGTDIIIGIENKILSDESEGQLRDYSAWLAEQPQKTKLLIFLTPEGRNPDQGVSALEEEFGGQVKIIRASYTSLENSNIFSTDQSTDHPHQEDLKDDFQTLDTRAAENHSYIPNLAAWLQRCLEKVALIPRLREVIAQYRDLVNRVGGQRMGDEEVDALSELIMEPETLQASFHIQNAIPKAKAKISYFFWEKLKENLEQGDDFYEVRLKEVSVNDLQKYLKPNIQNRPHPQLLCDIGLRWKEGRAKVKVELLHFSDRNHLTIKLLHPDAKKFTNLDETEKRLAEESQKRLGVIDRPNTSQASYITGDFLLKDGNRLDLTNFRGRALELADANKSEEIVREVADQVRLFVYQIHQSANAAGFGEEAQS